MAEARAAAAAKFGEPKRDYEPARQKAVMTSSLVEALSQAQQKPCGFQRHPVGEQMAVLLLPPAFAVQGKVAIAKSVGPWSFHGATVGRVRLQPYGKIFLFLSHLVHLRIRELQRAMRR